MPEVRRAGPDDAAELTRLRVVMFHGHGSRPGAAGPGLAAPQRRALPPPAGRRRRLRGVRGRPARRGLAASAVGWLNDHLISTANQTGRVGYVANMCTDPAYRRRGYGRATLVALLAWLRSTGITAVDLHATPDGESLYRSLGFTEPTDQALTLRFAPTTPTPGRR